ncbi:hypothetical protein K492DRAFT_211650 [Lichtheimia hyalospora FSU 10163]|nr:hypothetical protein K492DRAFT_211650 [Lichtheimia hyalospora FSU 10163]
MTISLGTNALDDLRMASSQGQHERVITDSKVIYQQLAHLHLETLDIQARSYVARAQFTTALDIASSMQEMNPASALGYLCQGYIHMQQGRCLAATRVYGKAMEHVPMTDTQYERIKEDKSMAIKRVAKRMDLIAYLPNDISFCIFPLLFNQCSYKEYRQYLLVSSTWLDRMLQWDQLEFSIVHYIPEEETNPAIIKSFHHVRSIQFVNCVRPFYKLFETLNAFQSLTSLNVQRSCLGSVDQVMSTLRSIGDALTTLTLRDYKRSDLTLCLNDILSSCPKLISLHCITDIKLSLLEGTYPSLLYLTLHPITQVINAKDLMDILPRFPCLKMLDLCYVITSMPMQVINTSLSALQDLKFTDSNGVFIPESVSLTANGLCSLDIKNQSFVYALEDILSLLVGRHATLNSLVIHHRGGPCRTQSVYDIMHKNDDIVFKHLETLNVRCMPETKSPLYLDMIAWIIQRSPNLRTSTIGVYMVKQPILSAMAQCIHLDTVYMVDVGRFSRQNLPDDYDALFSQFIKEHVDYMANRGGSRLRTLIMGTVAFNPMLAQSIGELSRLQCFRIASIQPMDASFGLLFKALGQGCPELHTLSLSSGIHGGRKLSNDVLYHMHALPNLQDLYIHADMSECNLGALSLQKCSRLQSVSLYRSKLHEEILRALKDKIPVVEA